MKYGLHNAIIYIAKGGGIMSYNKNLYINYIIVVLIFVLVASFIISTVNAETNTYKNYNSEISSTELFQPNANFTSFNDVKGHWAEKYMNELSYMEILNGFVDKTMKPDRVITRSEFITMVVRVMDLKDNGRKYSNYTDIPENHWAYSYINKAKGYGLLDYFNGKYFYPNKIITREEMAIIISKALPQNFQVDKQVSFSDIKSDYANKKSIDKAASAGIINGKPDGSFSPQGSSSRAEAAAMIYRFINLEADEQESVILNFAKGYETNIIKSANEKSSTLTGVIEKSIGKEKNVNNERKKVVLELKKLNLSRLLGQVHVNIIQNSLYKVVAEISYELTVERGVSKKTVYTITKILYMTYRDGSLKVYDSSLNYSVVSQEGSNKKINLTWDYIYKKTPDMTGVQKIDGLDVVSPTWFVLQDESINILDKADISYTNWAHDKGYNVWPLFGNGFDKEMTAKVLGNPSKRTKLVNKIIELSLKYNADGINMDFENMRTEDSDEYTLLIKELSEKAKEKGLYVSVDVTPINKHSNWSTCYNRKDLSKYADYIIIMGYDQHWEGSPVSGSVAQLNWVEDSLKKILEEVPADKLILAVPFYTRLWQETYVNGKTVVTSKALSMEEGEKAIKENNAIKVWDEESGQYYAEYKKDGSLYRIWLEDENSIKRKVQLANKYDIAGVASWRKGFEKPEIWNVIDSVLSAASL